MAPKPSSGCEGDPCTPTEGFGNGCCDEASHCNLICHGNDCNYECHDGSHHRGWMTPMPALQLLYVVGALLVVVLCTVNITCCLMKKRWGNTEGKSYKAVRVYDSEDQMARIPMKWKGAISAANKRDFSFFFMRSHFVRECRRGFRGSIHCMNASWLCTIKYVKITLLNCNFVYFRHSRGAVTNVMSSARIVWDVHICESSDRTYMICTICKGHKE